MLYNSGYSGQPWHNPVSTGNHLDCSPFQHQIINYEIGDRGSTISWGPQNFITCTIELDKINESQNVHNMGYLGYQDYLMKFAAL